MRGVKLLLLVLAVLLSSCGGEIDVCQIEQIVCLSQGGEWTPGPNCGTCKLPEPPPPCSDENPCPEGQICVDGECEAAPPPCKVGSCPRELDDPRMCVEGECVECKPDLSDAIWNTEAGDVTCSTPERPVKAWHPESECPTLTVLCETPLPQPQCKPGLECNCWRGLVKIECPDPPPVGTCELPTPTMNEAAAMGMRPKINIKRAGRAGIEGTPIATFGNDYYCLRSVNWPEACAGGRSRGPVAPEGHPQRLACEQHFLGGCGPLWSMDFCTGTSQQCPVSFDPWISINGVNQNHPANVKAGCGTQFGNHWSWEKIGGVGQPIKGMWWWATGHGKGHVKACNADGTVCSTSGFEVDN